MTSSTVRSGRRHTFMAAAAAMLAATGVILITTAMQSSGDHAPQPSQDAFGYVEPSRAVLADNTVKTADPIPPTTDQVAGADTDEVLSSPPIEIDIPSIGMHSTLQYLGLTASGEVEVPRSPRYHEAAWYKYSSTPGSPGPAVILGHVDSEQDGRSIFFHLGAVLPGDEILVTRSDGLIAVFVVDGVRSYPKDNFPTFLVYGPTEDSTLRVITCGGRWNSSARSFEENIVVFASLTEFRETPRHAIVG